MAKLSKQDKIDIYNNWKYYGRSYSALGREYGVAVTNISYLIHLIDRYGTEILDKTYTYYSVSFKEQVIEQALSKKKSLRQLALDLALPSRGMIYNWLRKYKEKWV